jgi:CDP-diglyceride synthetase
MSLLGFGYLGAGALSAGPAGAQGNDRVLPALPARAGKGSDMAAFVAGKSIGKHPMTPS